MNIVASKSTGYYLVTTEEGIILDQGISVNRVKEKIP